MKKVLLVLVLGLLGGAAGGYYGRPALDRAILGMGEVEGVVVSERREGDRLLLTLRSGDETIVASFVERADDVAELVSEGDTVTVRVGARGVFADDVPILRLRRAVDGPADPTAEAAAEEASADEEAPSEEAGDEEAGDEEAGDEAAGDEAAGDAPDEEADEAAEEPETEEASALRVASEARRGRREDRAEASPAADAAEAGDEAPPSEIVVPASIEEALAEATRRARARRHRRAAARRGRTVPAASPAAESEAEPATVPSEASRPVAEAAAAPPHEG